MPLKMCRLQEGIKWTCIKCKRVIRSEMGIFLGVSLNGKILCDKCAEVVLDKLESI